MKFGVVTEVSTFLVITVIGVYTLVSVQGSRATSHGKIFVVTKVSTL